MSRASDERGPKKAATAGSEPLERRAAIKALVGIGLAAGLQACGSLPEPAQPDPSSVIPDPAGADTPDPADPDAPAAVDPDAPDASEAPIPASEHDHPADGDRLVFAFGDREGQVIKPEDIIAGAPQVFAVPMDADASHVARESRLDQVILVRIDPSQMSEETAARAADGVVAYSAICTHTGCEIDDWDEDTKRFQCPCHDSEFDPADNGRVTGGPARRRLAALPLKIEDGALTAAGSFTGRVGRERRGANFANPWKRPDESPMKQTAAAGVLLISLASLVASPLTPALSAQGYRPVTDARLENPEPENWLSYRGNYAGWGYSALDQIDASNVAELVPVWTFSTGTRGGHEAPPIVNDGVMFVTTPGNQVLAIDARTGDLLWRYGHELPEDLVAFHDTNRGVALFGDKVYTATLDARVVALDARTGRVVWDTPVADNSSGYYMTLAPLAARGKIMVGVSGGELGIRGFVVALDSETGEEIWRTHTVPGPGEPGNDSWPGETWRTGGAAVWVTGHFDPESGLTYWGTGNPGPWIGDQRPGDNLYTNSVIALDVDTGELVAHHQYHWNGSWDWDEVSTPILMDVERDGRTFPALVHPGRNGYLWLLERETDAIRFVDAQPFVYQDVFTSIDPETGRPTYDEEKKPGTGKLAAFCPSLWGGKDWPPAAYNPITGLLYIPANEGLCGTSIGEEVDYIPGRAFTGADAEMTLRPGADHVGELQAWDMNAGEKVWTLNLPSHNWGPILTTAGGLVFMGGTTDRYFRAFDARTGEILWQQRTNSGIIGVPSTYEIDGVQYVAIQSGWGVDAQSMGGRIDELRGTNTFVPEGGVVWVFALRR